jgi:hypothetical protein
MLPKYTAHWKTLSNPIDILEIRPIEGGVWTLLRVHDEGRDGEVEYYFDEEGLQIKHIIKGFTPFEKEAGLTTNVSDRKETSDSA